MLYIIFKMDKKNILLKNKYTKYGILNNKNISNLKVI